MGSLFEFFRYKLPAIASGRFVSPVWDTGNASHGVAILPHASLWGYHGEQVEIDIEPLRPLTDEELAQLPRSGAPVCPISAGNDGDLPRYRARHFLFFPQQVEGATLGRSPRLEWYAGWLCIIGVGKVGMEEIDGRLVQGMIGRPGGGA